MRQFRWIVGCALLLGVGSRAPVQAQAAGDQELARNWEIRAGVFVPEREGARQKGGDVWFSIGAERPVYEMDRWSGTISIDYYGGGGTGGGIFNIPITFNLRGTTHRFRYGAGVGISIGHDVERGITNFAYNLLLGYTLMEGKHPISLDVRYLGVGRSDGQLNGWDFTFGYHF